MSDLLAAIGLVFVLEGALYALFPRAAIRMAETLVTLSPQALRLGGLTAIGIGWLIVWLARG